MTTEPTLMDNLPTLLQKRYQVQVDIRQEKAAQGNGLRGMIADSNIRTLNKRLTEIELEIAINVGDVKEAKRLSKILKNWK